MGTLKTVNLHPFDIAKGTYGRIPSIQVKMHLAFGQLLQGINTPLEILFRILQEEIKVRGQRRGIECRDKNRFRLTIWFSYGGIRTLPDSGPEATIQQVLHDLLTLHLCRITLEK